MKIKNLVILSALTVLIIGCNEEQDYTISPRPFPVIETNPVTDIGSTTAEFGAKILLRGDKEITSYGFTWHPTIDPRIQFGNNQEVFGEPKGESFSATITTLEPNTKYQMRAFVIIDEANVYGDKVVFTTN